MGGQQRIGQVHEAEGAAARSGHGWCRRARACTTLRRERPPADALCRRAGLGERGLAGMGLVRLRELAGMGRARLLARAEAGKGADITCLKTSVFISWPSSRHIMSCF